METIRLRFLKPHDKRRSRSGFRPTLRSQKCLTAHAGHDRHAGHSVAMFRDKFWLSFALTIPVVFWSPDVQHWLGYTAPAFPGSKFIPPILGTVVFIYGGLVFIRGAWGELADHKPSMMTLISLGIIAAFGTSLAATFGLFELDVWWELTSLITVMLLGHWLEMRPFPRRAAPSVRSPPFFRTPLNVLRAKTPNLFHSLNCALATSFSSDPEPAFRQMEWSLRAQPMLTSP